MDMQALLDSMNETLARDRGNYHLTYGDLIGALLKAPKGAVVDERFKGIGSWRGSYIEVAIFTEETGMYATDGEFDGEYRDYDEWERAHATAVKELPTNANELGRLLESLLGKDFIGYKGGNFTIENYKPLWLEEGERSFTSVAVVGIDEDLKLITKKTTRDD